MFADQQIGGSPDVAIGDQFRFIPLGSILVLSDLASVARRGPNRAAKLPHPANSRRRFKASPYRFVAQLTSFLVPRLEHPTPFPNRYHRGEVKREAPMVSHFRQGYL